MEPAHQSITVSEKPARRGLTVLFNSKFRHWIGFDRPMEDPTPILESEPDQSPLVQPVAPVARPPALRRLAMTPAEMAESSIPMVVLFGGHAMDADALTCLRGLYDRKAECRPLMEVAGAVIDEFLQSVNCATFAPEGFPLLNWLQLPQDRVPTCRSLFFAIPLIFIYHIACFLSAASTGIDYVGLHSACSALLGFGQGVLAALCISISPSEGELYAHFKAYLRAILWVGYHHEIVAQSTAKINLEKYQGVKPTFLLLVVDCPVVILQKFLHVCNDASKQSAPTFSDLELAEVFSPTVATVSGHPADLYRLYFTLASFGRQTRRLYRTKFLPVGGPRYSQYFLAQVPRKLINAWKKHKFDFHKFPHRVPVLSPVDGSDITVGTDLNDLVPRLLCQSTQSIPCAAHRLTFENILDLGPATSVQMRTSSYVSAVRPETGVLLAPQMELLPPPHQPRKRFVHRKAVFTQLATFNEVLEELHIPSAVEFDTTWVSLGLTCAASSADTLRSPQRHLQPSSPFRGFGESEKGTRLSGSSTSSHGITGSSTPVRSLASLEDDVTLPLGSLFVEGISDRLGLRLPPDFLSMCPTVEEAIQYIDSLTFLEIDQLLPRDRDVPSRRQSRYSGIGGPRCVSWDPSLLRSASPPPLVPKKASSAQALKSRFWNKAVEKDKGNGTPTEGDRATDAP